MSITLGSLVEGVLSALYGAPGVQDRVAYLTAPITATDTKIMVDDASYVGAGLVEVDTELMRIRSVDTQSNTLTLVPAGRGVRGTTAVSHSSGAEMRVAPVLSYSSVIREIGAEIVALYPALCAVSTVEFTSSSTKVTYGLPADVDHILDVQWRTPVGDWVRVRGWEAGFSQNTTDYPTGRVLLADVPVAVTVRVTYGKRFTAPTALTDTLESLGVPEQVEDILRMGAELRLLHWFDVARLSVSSVPSADANGRPPQPATGVMVSREIKQQYLVRLQSETTAFRLKYPARAHYTR